MAKTYRSKSRHSKSRHSTRRRHSRIHRQKAGQSAWQNVMNTVGDGMTQFRNSLMINPQQNIAAVQSNDVVPISNPNAQISELPNLQNGMNGGKRRRRHHKKGGFWGSLLNEALVPFSLLGLQQVYGKPKTRKAKHYK
jgi:hypothetical protein